MTSVHSDVGSGLDAALRNAHLRIVELAGLAPSVRNSQPWRWVADGSRLDLRADRSRMLRVGDEDGRMLTLSCGAALDHAIVAARALGFGVDERRFPDPNDPDLLATLRLHPAALPLTAASDLQAIGERRTDRRRFTSWPVSFEQVQDLCHVAADRGVTAVPVVDLADRVRIDLLLGRAGDRQARAQARLGGRGFRSPFADTPYVAPDRDLEPADGLLVLGGPPGQDTPMTWLAVGEALSALWLEATRAGLSIVPLSVICEVAETRAVLEHEVLGGLMTPQLLVRVGWQAIGRPRRTPRRAVEDMLELRTAY